MIVKNKTERIFNVSVSAPGAPVELLTFRPGVNQVPPERLSAFETSIAKATHAFHGWTKSGWLEIVGKKNAKGVGLAGFSVAEATALVADCYDTSLLDRWFSHETRGEVREIVLARKRELEDKLRQTEAKE